MSAVVTSGVDRAFPGSSVSGLNPHLSVLDPVVVIDLAFLSDYTSLALSIVNIVIIGGPYLICVAQTGFTYLCWVCVGS